MKIEHKLNGYAPDRTDPHWAEKVEREAEAITDQAARRYAKAQERLERAEAKLQRETTRKKPDRKLLRRLTDAVEARRQELADLHRQMTATSAASTNRGRKSFRGVTRGEVS